MFVLKFFTIVVGIVLVVFLGLGILGYAVSDPDEPLILDDYDPDDYYVREDDGQDD